MGGCGTSGVARCWQFTVGLIGCVGSVVDGLTHADIKSASARIHMNLTDFLLQRREGLSYLPDSFVARIDHLLLGHSGLGHCLPRCAGRRFQLGNAIRQCGVVTLGRGRPPLEGREQPVSDGECQSQIGIHLMCSIKILATSRATTHLLRL